MALPDPAVGPSCRWRKPPAACLCCSGKGISANACRRRALSRRFDQMLVDFQVPAYTQVTREAGPKAAVLVTSGDVWLDFDPLQIPPASGDITGIGMRVAPEVAQHFGSLFRLERAHAPDDHRDRPIAFFLQKPSPEEIYRHSARYDSFVDTGMWLLSLDALRFLLQRCKWDSKAGKFATSDGYPAYLDLYTEIGAALGTQGIAPANLRRLGWSRLRSSVIPLEDAQFYHLGSSRQLFESFEQIQRGRYSPQKTLCAATPPSAFFQSVRPPRLAGFGASGSHPSTWRATTSSPVCPLKQASCDLPKEAVLRSCPWERTAAQCDLPFGRHPQRIVRKRRKDLQPGSGRLAQGPRNRWGPR